MPPMPVPPWEDRNVIRPMSEIDKLHQLGLGFQERVRKYIACSSLVADVRIDDSGAGDPDFEVLFKSGAIAFIDAKYDTQASGNFRMSTRQLEFWRERKYPHTLIVGHNPMYIRMLSVHDVDLFDIRQSSSDPSTSEGMASYVNRGYDWQTGLQRLSECLDLRC